MEHFVTIRAKTIDFEGSKKDYLITLLPVVSHCCCETIGNSAYVLCMYDEAYCLAVTDTPLSPSII